MALAICAGKNQIASRAHWLRDVASSSNLPLEPTAPFNKREHSGEEGGDAFHLLLNTYSSLKSFNVNGSSDMVILIMYTEI